MRNVLSILLLCGFGSSLCLAELDENQDFKSGLDALNSHLPEVAVLKFQAALSSEDCTTDEKRELLYRLAEAQVRAVKGTDAEETLASPELGDSVKTNFWKAQALFAQGRHEEAAIAFEKIAVSEESEFRSLSLLALSELYRSLRKPEKAFEVLMKAADTRKLSQAVNLKLVELYLEKDLLVEAENLVNEIQPKGGNDENVKQFLTARILLEKGESEKSSDIFSLLKETENLNAVLSFASLLGYVDSQFKEQNWEQGIDELVQLIENEPQSSYIHLAFNRLRIVLGEEFNNTALISSLDQWIEPAPIANLDEELEADDEEAFEFTYPDRDAFSRFVRALILADSEDSENLEKSNILLNSLREHHPEHFLSTVSWMQTAVNQIKSEKLEQALVALKKMQEAGLTKELKAKAIAMQAMLLAEDSRISQAVEELNKIIDLEAGELSETAKVNIALIRLQNLDALAFEEQAKEIKDESIKAGLFFTRGMNALNSGEIGARENLEKLINLYPNHQTSNQVSIRLAKDYLKNQPLKIPAAISHLENVIEKLEGTDQQAEVKFLLSRAYVFNEDWDKVIQEYQIQLTNLIAKSETDSELYKKLQLSLGEAYYRNGEFINARKIFGKVIENEDSLFTDYAYFFSALSARKEGTPQGKEEGEKLLKRVADGDSSFAVEATIQLARIYIDSDKIDLAESLLLNQLKETNISNSERFDCQLLLADLKHREGVQDNDEGKLKEAISIYSMLVKDDSLDSVSLNRIHYLKGEAQEKLGPNYTEALATYYSIVNLDYQTSKEQPIEWEWYYKAGLRAVELLEKQERWEPAVILLEKMSGYYGPKSDILIEKTTKLKLEHHIF